MKYLRFTMENGEVWDVPAIIIAESRAKYYAKTDRDTTFQEEVDYAMEDEYACSKWAQGDMNWSEIKSHAIKRESAEKPDYQHLYCNAETEFAEVEDV